MLELFLSSLCAILSAGVHETSVFGLFVLRVLIVRLRPAWRVEHLDHDLGQVRPLQGGRHLAGLLGLERGYSGIGEYAHSRCAWRQKVVLWFGQYSYLRAGDWEDDFVERLAGSRVGDGKVGPLLLGYLDLDEIGPPFPLLVSVHHEQEEGVQFVSLARAALKRKVLHGMLYIQ